jgi:hypothetical protein
LKAQELDEENKLRTEYGLKKRLRFGKALAKVNYFRARAKALAKAPLTNRKFL